MALSPSSRLGPYEILSPLGAGGMGEVYRARDTRLGRDVAIKVLPAALTGRADIRARFEREARTVSALNHPHICVVHDVGREGDTDYFVMELVEGETLASRLERGALPVSEVLRLGTQIADALDRAHRAGVIHRDLKPGNVMLTRSGVKLMDFGLARTAGLGAGNGASLGGGLTQTPTVAAPLTAEGTIVGTFQYMAPEQLEGKEADARSDIWALGCVLYEMATGQRAFDGKSQASLISAIMGRDPAPISQLAPMSPPALDRVVRYCLAKDPDQRIQTGHDARLHLAGIDGASPASGIELPGTPVPSRTSASAPSKLPWVIAAIAVALAIAAWVLPHSGARPPRVTRTALLPTPGTQMNLSGDAAGPPVISPDGTQLVFSAIGGGAGSRLWIRRMDEFTARPLEGTDGATFPFWSPDGRSIAFFTSTDLKRIDLDGGAVLTVATAPHGSRGGSWSKNGTILYTPGYLDGLMRVPASGGAPVVVTTLDSTQTTHRWPQVLPDGKHFIYFAAAHENLPTSAIWFGSLDGGAPRLLFRSPSSAVYASGWLLFVKDSTLLAQRFDPVAGRLIGEVISTAEVVQRDPSTWRTILTASENGVLVYGLGGHTTPFRVTLLDRAGRTERTLGYPANHISVAMSRDGGKVMVETQYTPNADLWCFDLATGVRRRITDTVRDENSPVWSPDGGQVAFATPPTSQAPFYATHVVRSDGVGPATLIYADSAADAIPMSW